MVETPAPDIRSLRPDLPPALSAVLARALDKDPARRFGSAEAVALYRLNALDANVKGVLEHGLQ